MSAATRAGGLDALGCGALVLLVALVGFSNRAGGGYARTRVEEPEW